MLFCHGVFDLSPITQLLAKVSRKGTEYHTAFLAPVSTKITPDGKMSNPPPALQILNYPLPRKLYERVLYTIVLPVKARYNLQQE